MIQAALWNADHLKPQDKFVALAIASHADVLGVCRADTQRLAERTGYTPTSIRNSVRRLLRGHVLNVTGSRAPDRYTFTAQFQGVC